MQKADIGASAANSHFVRIADLDGDRSEGPQAAQIDLVSFRPIAAIGATRSECRL
ncbi:MAG: hypothetical protein ACJA1E_000548 [Paracoccaceae bacterium]|jgi:hypothetical protein